MPLNSPVIARITANGSPLRLGNRVTSFRYEDVEKGDDMLSIVLSDYDHSLRDLDIFKENTQWVVQWGFPEKMHDPRIVYVKRPKFKHGVVEVECLDKGSALRISENWGVAKDKKMSEIVTDIAKKNGLKPVIDAGIEQVIPFFSFGGLSDWDVLKYLEGLTEEHVFKVSSDKLIFKKRDLDAPPAGRFEFAPGPDSRLLSYEIGVKDQDNAKTAKQTTAVSVDPYTMTKIVAKADESTTTQTNLGSRRVLDNYLPSFIKNIPGVSTLVKLGGFGKTTSQGDSTGKSMVVPPKTEEELNKIAKGEHKKAVLGAVEGKFSIMASPQDPLFKVGDLIQIQGIGVRNSGNWYITKITHDLSAGYKYDIETQRNAVNTGGASKSGKKLNGKGNSKPPQDFTITRIPKEIKTSGN